MGWCTSRRSHSRACFRLYTRAGGGGGADEQLRGDPRVGGANADQARDKRFLDGQGLARLRGALAGVPAAGAQLCSRSVGEGRGTVGVEDLVCPVKLIPRVTLAAACIAGEPSLADMRTP